MAFGDELVQRLIEIIQQLRQKIEEARAFVDSMLQSLDSFWDWLKNIIRDGMNDLAQKAQDFFGKIEEVLPKPGSATALEDAGRRWHEEVAMPANRLAGDLSLDRLGVDDYWAGTAGSAYKTTVPAHSGAFNDIRIAADGIQGSLTSMANEVRGFFTASIAAAGIALGGVIALAAVVLPPATPAAIAVAATAIGTALGLLTTAISSLTSFMNGARSQQTALTQQLDRITAWPTPNQELSNQTGWQVDENI
jgi:hypothetical protein